MAGLKECPNRHLFNATKHGDKCPHCGANCKDIGEDALDGELLEVMNQEQYTCAWLVCVEGMNKGRSYPVHVGKNFIGRGNDMDIQVLGDLGIDVYRHGAIVFDNRSQSAMALPGESRRLMYLNDAAVYEPRELNAYSELLVGETKFLYLPFCGGSFSWSEA